jgi:hypothetical protein
MRRWRVGVWALALGAAGPSGGRQLLAQTDPRSDPTQVAGAASEAYPLRPRKDGAGWVYENPRFTAFVALDGTVTFDDTHIDFRASPAPLPLPVYEHLYGGPRITEREQFQVPTPATEPVLPDYGSAAFTRPSDLPGVAIERMGQPDPPSMRRLPLQPDIFGAGWRFDLSDEVMRLHDEDPYRLQKADFLTATFEMRAGLAAQAHDSNIRLALGDLPDHLDKIWRDPGMAPAEKRQVLFALWQETSDTPEGQAARRVIETFIRTNLPEGSPYAYSAAELARYRGEEAPARFDPYG